MLTVISVVQEARGGMLRWYSGLRAGWLGFNSGREIFLFSVKSRPVLGPTELHM
jgi:hypothetical protein